MSSPSSVPTSPLSYCSAVEAFNSYSISIPSHIGPWWRRPTTPRHGDQGDSGHKVCAPVQGGVGGGMTAQDSRSKRWWWSLLSSRTWSDPPRLGRRQARCACGCAGKRRWCSGGARHKVVAMGQSSLRLRARLCVVSGTSI
jgi:hypothetical protein